MSAKSRSPIEVRRVARFVPPRPAKAKAFRGRVDFRRMISELAIAEVLSAVACRKRAGELEPELANRIRDAVLTDADSGSFARLHLDLAVHRRAERLLLATP
jgi:hypothetical protein